MSLKNIYEAVKQVTDLERGQLLQSFFKTGKGQYAQGDIFLGINNPSSRKIALENKQLKLDELQELIESKYHEERFIALVILTHKYKTKLKDTKLRDKNEESCYQFYLKNMKHVNNWDLVDCSAPNIMGAYLLQEKRKQQRSIWKQLVRSQNLFFRRIAIISTLTFIRDGQLQPTFEISEQLLEDQQDLIHKGVGWMLREAGKRNEKTLEQFLQKHYDRIPRTCLRYAIEKFPEEKRQRYLKKIF